MKAFLIDDEALAISRMKRLLAEDGRVEIVGSSSLASHALEEIPRLLPDVLFLDIRMPEMSGFEMLERLEIPSPLVIFTTAFGEYALEAFEVHSIDYLLKPIQQAHLSRAIGKLQRILGGSEVRGNMGALLDQLRLASQNIAPAYLTRVASRTGARVEFVEVRNITHFYSLDKLTFAATASKDYALDLTIAELEQRLPPRQWLRIHRSTLLNIEAVKGAQSWVGGKLMVRLKTGKDLQVARERAAEVREKLGL